MRICIHCRKWYQESFHRRVTIVATLVTSELAAFGGRYFRGVVTFGEQRSFTNRAGASLFSDGIDGLPDYRMGESADIRGDRVLH